MKRLEKLLLLISTAILITSCSTSSKWMFPDADRWIDLSHAYDAQTPYWPTSDGFRLDTVFEGMTEGGYYYSAYAFRSAEHGGTHIDAPIHFAKGKQTVDEIPIQRLTGHAILVDVRDSVSAYIDYQINQADFEQWERKHGKIPDDAIVLMNTGFGRFWPNKERYLGTDKSGVEALPLLHFPGLDPKAAVWLTENRKIKAIGLDTPSIDYGRSSNFLSHQILFAENIPAFENLANLNQLPAVGFYIVALPMKIKGGSGGPLRIIAYIP